MGTLSTHFSNETFRKVLLNKLLKEVFVTNDESLLKFYRIYIDTSNKHAPRKKKHTRDNQI